ncbi:MAG: hypothetical protein C5B59_11510 [Bacteroidetes bacterium]|nr:MAG: hypothetical protein C5B59_11510 [Bacteroidota bacterium]
MRADLWQKCRRAIRDCDAKYVDAPALMALVWRRSLGSAYWQSGSLGLGDQIRRMRELLPNDACDLMRLLRIQSGPWRNHYAKAQFEGIYTLQPGLIERWNVNKRDAELIFGCRVGIGMVAVPRVVHALKGTSVLGAISEFLADEQMQLRFLVDLCEYYWKEAGGSDEEAYDHFYSVDNWAVGGDVPRQLAHLAGTWRGNTTTKDPRGTHS